MTETGAIPAEQAALRRPPPAPEPATPRALWPTFLRRTLEEEALRPARQAAAGPGADAG
jgi:hypothetical protein